MAIMGGQISDDDEETMRDVSSDDNDHDGGGGVFSNQKSEPTSSYQELYSEPYVVFMKKGSASLAPHYDI
jgi:hypothetical protein